MFDEQNVEKYFLPEREPIVWQNQSDPEFLQKVFDKNPQAFIEEQRQDQLNLERARTTAHTLQKLINDLEAGRFIPAEDIFLSALLTSISHLSISDKIGSLQHMLQDAQEEIEMLEDITAKREKIITESLSELSAEK